MLLSLLIWGLIPLKSDCDICDTYSGNSKTRWQTLIIKPNGTFEYTYRDNWATLIGGKTKGNWEISDDQLVLMSEYNDQDFTVTTHHVNWCQSPPNDPYLMENCENLIKIQVANKQDEGIWFLKSVMINQDTTQISMMGFDENSNLPIEQLESFEFFVEDEITHINFFNGFYDEFEVKINDPSANHILIKGNFSDELWYTYIINEKWDIKKKKLVHNKTFGSFKRQ